jgi:hypothetical protein
MVRFKTAGSEVFNKMVEKDGKEEFGLSDEEKICKQYPSSFPRWQGFQISH